MTKKISEEKLTAILSNIREELDLMHDFEYQLHTFDKKTLCLFIMLILDDNSYHPAIEIMKFLEATAILPDLPNIVAR